MMFAGVMLLGLAAILLLPGKTAVIIAIGAIAGFLYALAEVKWPKPQPPYMDPVTRPKPRTTASGFIAAAAVAIGSLVIAILVFAIILPRFPLGGVFGLYLAAVGAGLATGIALTARRSSETHNAWLAAMTPQAPLDF